MQRNLILEIEETRQELVYVINRALKDRNIPFYFIEPMLKELHREIYNGSQQELSTLIKQEQAQLEQLEKENLQSEPEEVMEENNEN